MTLAKKKRDVSREARDKAGRWSKVGGGSESEILLALPSSHVSQGSSVRNDNLVPPPVSVPPVPFPRDLAALGTQILSFRQQGEKPGTWHKGVMSKDWKDEISSIYGKELLEAYMVSQTIYTDRKGYQGVYGTTLDDDIQKFVDGVHRKFFGSAARERERTAREKLEKKRFPSAVRSSSVPETGGVPGFEKYPSIDILAKMIAEKMPESPYAPYEIAEMARFHFLAGAPHTSSWQKETEKVVQKKLRSIHKVDKMSEADKADEYLQVMGCINGWALLFEERLDSNRDKLRTQYRGLISGAWKDYRSSGAKDPEEWLDRLSKDPKHMITNPNRLMVYPDESPLADEFRFGVTRIPMAANVLKKLQNHTVQIKHEDGPVTDLGARAFYQESVIHVQGQEKADVFTHEYGHHIESVLGLTLALKQWVIDRATYTPMKLGDGYADSEVAFPDEFITRYVGKTYGYATEVLSMGIQAVLVEPNLFKMFDPEHFMLTMGVLLGKSDDLMKSIVRDIGLQLYSA